MTRVIKINIYSFTLMDVLDKSFKSAVEIVNNLKQKPTNEELLQLYGLFKQSNLGDNNTNKPAFIDFKGCKKWDAWESLKGKSQNESKQEYITLAMNLFKNYG